MAQNMKTLKQWAEKKIEDKAVQAEKKEDKKIE